MCTWRSVCDLGHTSPLIEARGDARVSVSESQLSCVAVPEASAHRRARVGRRHQPAGAARHRPRARGGGRGGGFERRGRPRAGARGRAWGAHRGVRARRRTPTARRATRRSPTGWPSAARGWWCSPATWSCSASGFLARFPGAVDQRAPLAAAGLPGPARDRAGARVRGEGVRRDRPLRRRGRRQRPGDPSARGRAAGRARRPRRCWRRCARSSTRCCPRRCGCSRAGSAEPRLRANPRRVLLAG